MALKMRKCVFFTLCWILLLTINLTLLETLFITLQHCWGCGLHPWRNCHMFPAKTKHIVLQLTLVWWCGWLNLKDTKHFGNLTLDSWNKQLLQSKWKKHNTLAPSTNAGHHPGHTYYIRWYLFNQHLPTLSLWGCVCHCYMNITHWLILQVFKFMVLCAVLPMC